MPNFTHPIANSLKDRAKRPLGTGAAARGGITAGRALTEVRDER